jgi:peptidoglycan/LPS O-acetylase OafA/YrhL
MTLYMPSAVLSPTEKPSLTPIESPKQPLSFDANASYIPYLDGLRAVSIILVMAAHFGFGNLVPAGFGVTIFFFISGFLITRLLFSEERKSKTNTISIRAFYIRRVFRILPALTASILGVVLAYATMGVSIPTVEILSSFFFFQNYLINAYHAAGHNPVLPLNCLWSLAVEEHFYIFWPFLFSLLSKNIRRFTFIVASVLVITLLWRVLWIYVLKGDPLYCYYATDTRVDSILYGSLMSILCLDKTVGQKLLKACSKWLYAGLGLLVASFLIKDEGIRQSLRYSLQGVGLFLVFSGLLFSHKYGFIKALLENNLSRFIGKISYSLYLWHFALYHILGKLFPTLQSLTLAGLATVASFAIASLSYYLIEGPFITLRKKLAW